MLKVHSFESMGTFDGPGLRFVVFLQGCNFKCLYCANADTIDALADCQQKSDQDILNMAISLKPFFGKKGGVTFSGGEPTFQAKELKNTVVLLKESGFNVCIDTNGSIFNKDVEHLFELSDLVLLDIKQFNNDCHKALTNHSNSQTLKSAEWLEKNNKPFWLRYVLVPGYSDNPEDIQALCEHFKNYTQIQRIEILPYHIYGAHKYEPLGLEYKLKDVEENTPEQLEKAKAIFDKYFKTVYIN